MALSPKYLSLSCLSNVDNIKIFHREKVKRSKKSGCNEPSKYMEDIYTVARRYEFYVRVAKTISHSFASLTREILFLPLNIKFISSNQRVMFFLLYGD